MSFRPSSGVVDAPYPLRDVGPAPLVSPEPGEHTARQIDVRAAMRAPRRAHAPETRALYRPMIFSEETVASVAAGKPAEPIGTWRLRREWPHETRILADSSDRRRWLEQRSLGVTATDAAKLATPASVQQVVRDKLQGGAFGGNAYTDYGRFREPHIAAWVNERHGIEPCGLLFHAESSKHHLATPDGLRCDDEGNVVLAEIKTTKKPWSRIPRGYLRQVWWQQYVLGAERTLFVWERHRDFVVVDDEPRSVWIERDDAEIARMVELAEEVLATVAEMRQRLEPPLLTAGG